MSNPGERISGQHHFGLSLSALVNLRWLAVAGQTVALAIVEWGLDYSLPAIPAFAIVGVTAAVNVALRLGFATTYRLSDKEAGALLGFDIVQLAMLLYLTGGLVNPFSVLFLAPVLISAMALKPRTTLLLGALVVTVSTVLAVHSLPLPWNGEPIVLPPPYVAGIWFSIVISVVFIGAYAWRVADETRKLSDALSATELVLAREQQISAIDGLAAAAAHELGTPLATIALVTRELERAIPEDAQHGADIRLLRQQTERCRTILRTLTSLESGLAPFDKMPLSHLIEEVVAPLRDFDIEFEIRLPEDRSNEPIVVRNPAILYGLESIVENAADFAKEKVTIVAEWNAMVVNIAVSDDGPGFAPEIIGRIGEPYLRARGQSPFRRNKGDEERGGLGLGFFIAKTLLERGGGSLRVENRTPPHTGAVVRVSWRREALEVASGTTQARTERPAEPSLASDPRAH
ncbi:MAG: ActS/PrrB/RegB family redox-sensitive histidine kinase [Xanthobacteraceae bacterium]|nr:ActS/PrrB/RegB family redox-sensitive histidine kinase [Xanthobacteraceae bacterium]